MRRIVALAAFFFSTWEAFSDAAAGGLLQKDWFLGGLCGAAATVLGFALTFVWDLYKLSRDATEREKVVMRSVNEELSKNLAAVQFDLELIMLELPALSERRNLIEPMKILKTGFWDVAKINLPAALIKGDRLQMVRDLVSLAETCNEEIRSRENYRIHNQAMSNLSDRLRIYDELLNKNLSTLKAALGGYLDTAD